jgi:hypothetical protein
MDMFTYFVSWELSCNYTKVKNKRFFRAESNISAVPKQQGKILFSENGSHPV